MLRMFARGTAVVVTQPAVERRSLELAADVTTGTVEELVSANQRVAGGEMIEAFIDIYSLSSRQLVSAGNQQQAEHYRSP